MLVRSADPDPSVPLTNRSGSDSGSGFRIFFVSDLQDDKKNFFKVFSYYYLKLHLHNFSKIKIYKEVNKTTGINVFLTIFA
jgi:hypothetical protein